MVFFCVFFFFKQKTAYEMRISDWSSDVCSSDLTNLIALDLGARGDPMEALARVLEIAKSGIGSHVVARELIAVSDGRANPRPVLGMFLGGAGLADSILFCRHKIRSEEHTSELQSLMRISYAVFCLKKKKTIERIIGKPRNYSDIRARDLNY